MATKNNNSDRLLPITSRHKHRIMKKHLALTICMSFTLILLLGGCDKDRMCRVPLGDATCQINPNSAEYPGLNNLSGYQYIVGGYQGLVVIRTSWSEFVAYERTCPHDEGRLEMAEGYGNLVLQCPECGSQFSTFADGAPMEGSLTSCLLRQYDTYYDGTLLYISNI